MKKKINNVILMTLFTAMTSVVVSCDSDEVNSSSETSDLTKATASKESEDIYKMTIDNGLEGDILVLKNSEVYEKIEDELYNSTFNYLNSVKARIPAGLSEEEENNYLTSIGYDEDIIFKNFEKQYNFNSLRVDLNTKTDLWLADQTTEGRIINEEEDPDNHPVVLESDRTLFNSGGEIIILDETYQPVIYKMFDWGSLKILNLDTQLLKQINISKIKSFEDISSLTKTNKNYVFENVNINIPESCASSGINHKKYNYSSTNRLVKSFTKQMVIPFTSGKKLVAKTVGYRYSKKKGYYRIQLHLVTGITGSKSQSNVPAEVFLDGCHNPADFLYVPAVSYNVTKLGVKMGNYDYIYLKNNKVYSYHGEGHFVFTKDFFPPNHEIYAIHNN